MFEYKIVPSLVVDKGFINSHHICLTTIAMNFFLAQLHHYCPTYNQIWLYFILGPQIGYYFCTPRKFNIINVLLGNIIFAL